MRLTRVYRFSASHRLHAAGLSEEANRALYGKCNNPYGHGHDYAVEIGVEGPVEARTGRVVDIAALDKLVRAEVIDAFDHRNLNKEAPEFASAVPTTENLARAIEARLEWAWPEGWPRLARIGVEETPRNRFEIEIDQPRT